MTRRFRGARSNFVIQLLPSCFPRVGTLTRHSRDRDREGARRRVPTGEMVGTKVKHSELRQAVKDLQNRGLLHSARWAAEQLYGLEDESPEDAAPASAGTVTPAARAPDDEDDAMELETPVSGGRGLSLIHI